MTAESIFRTRFPELETLANLLSEGCANATARAGTEGPTPETVAKLREKQLLNQDIHPSCELDCWFGPLQSAQTIDQSVAAAELRLELCQVSKRDAVKILNAAAAPERSDQRALEV